MFSVNIHALISKINLSYIFDSLDTRENKFSMKKKLEIKFQNAQQQRQQVSLSLKNYTKNMFSFNKCLCCRTGIQSGNKVEA